MQRAIIGFENWSDDFIPNTLPNRYNPAFPPSNIIIPKLSVPMQTANLRESETIFWAVASAPRPVKTFTISHNMSVYGEFRLFLHDDYDEITNVIYQTEWQKAWPIAYPTSKSNFYRPFWWIGSYDDKQRKGISPTTFIVLPQPYFATSYTLQMRDTRNPAGYIEIKYVDISSGWQLSVNPDYGAQIGTRFRDLVSETEGGAEFVEEQAEQKVFVGTIPSLPLEEAQQKYYEFRRQMKRGKPFLWMLNPEDATNWNREAFLAVQAEEPQLITRSGHDRASITLNLKEMIA